MPKSVREPAQPKPAAPIPVPVETQAPPAPPRPTPQPEAAPVSERAAHTLAAVQPAPEPTPAEPLIEGFFVARVQGELEARRHHLTEDQVRPPLETGGSPHWIEHLPDIPWGYEDDRVVLLARDPVTAWLYWDFSAQTRHGAFEGLRDPKVVARVLEAGREVRTVDITLESRSWYLGGLTPGRCYRVEIHAVSTDGISRRIGASSNAVTLAPDDISSDTSVRFMKVDWDAPLNRMKENLQTGRASVQAPETPPEALEIVTRRWVPMPTSGSWQMAESRERILRTRPEGEGTAPEVRAEHLEFGSWTLSGSSWWSSPTSASWMFVGASRAPIRNGDE